MEAGVEAGRLSGNYPEWRAILEMGSTGKGLSLAFPGQVGSP